MVDFKLVKCDFSQKKSYWKHYVDLACYYTGGVEFLVEEDTDDSIKKFFVREREKTVGCFSIFGNTVFNIAYERIKDDIKKELLEFLIDQWIELTISTIKKTGLRLRVSFPSCDQRQLEEKGFRFIFQRDRMTLSLETWIPPMINSTNLWDIRQVTLKDLKEVTEVFLDAYRGTIDEQLFVPGGLKMEEELKYLSTFLQNKNNEFPIIKTASLVATLSEGEIGGLCFISSWRDLPFVWEMVVSKKHQRKGIGKSLLIQSLLKVGKLGYKQITLFVTKGNNRARKLYDSIGFKADNCNLIMLEKE